MVADLIHGTLNNSSQDANQLNACSTSRNVIDILTLEELDSLTAQGNKAVCLSKSTVLPLFGSKMQMPLNDVGRYCTVRLYTEGLCSMQSSLYYTLIIYVLCIVCRYYTKLLESQLGIDYPSPTPLLQQQQQPSWNEEETIIIAQDEVGDVGSEELLLPDNTSASIEDTGGMSRSNSPFYPKGAYRLVLLSCLYLQYSGHFRLNLFLWLYVATSIRANGTSQTVYFDADSNVTVRANSSFLRQHTML